MGKRGIKGKHIRAGVLRLQAQTPGLFTCDMCRLLNGIRHITFCSNKSCYANPRKRARGGIVKSPCEYSLQLLRYHLSKLVNEGFLFKVKEFRDDNYQARGYDLYTCYYPK